MPQRIFNAQIDVYAKDRIELRMRCVTQDRAQISDNMDAVIVSLEEFAGDLGIAVTKTADLQKQYNDMADMVVQLTAENDALRAELATLKGEA